MTFDFISKEKFSAVESFALAKPPSWTRLEPVSTTGDPRPGVEARVHDPLWLLGRQWQLGEFAGEDAGTPLSVRVVTSTVPVDRWAPGLRGPAQPLDGDPLEARVEREPVPRGTFQAGPGLRPRAEAGAALVAALVDEGLTAQAAAVARRCPLDRFLRRPPARAQLDPGWTRLAPLLRGRGMADGERAARQLEAAAPDLPSWLAPADGLAAVLDTWLTWYRDEVAPRPGGRDAWVGSRFEHRFRIGAGDRAFVAPAHGGGELDWHTFDALGSSLPLPDGAAPDPRREVHAMLASPLRYPGMPADRLWEMEDSQVDLGVVEAEPWDLARLLVAEFALTYGNDWLVVPLDVAYGSLVTIESLVFTTTFGERYVVRPTTEVSPDGRWRMFTVTTGNGRSAEGLLVPPGSVAVQDGPPVEEVLFLRDEMANLAWAVERSVQGPSGLARDRSRENDQPPPIEPGAVTSAELDYRLQTGVPARWIPYLPVRSGHRSVSLQQGRMPDASGEPVAPVGRLLTTAGLGVVPDSEIPREGVLVRRTPSMTRRSDGTYLRWTTRRTGVGRGEGASRLGFDVAEPRG